MAFVSAAVLVNDDPAHVPVAVDQKDDLPRVLYSGFRGFDHGKCDGGGLAAAVRAPKTVPATTERPRTGTTGLIANADIPPVRIIPACVAILPNVRPSGIWRALPCFAIRSGGRERICPGPAW